MAEPPGSAAGRRLRRGGLLAAVLVAVVTASLAFVAGRLTSPQQRAADSAAPAVSVATATVALRLIHRPVVGRGEVGFANPLVVRFPSMGEGGDTVTHTPLRPGNEVVNGAAILEVAGHPVIAVEAPFSPYRDLRAGDSGRDVTVLLHALRQAAYPVIGTTTLTARDLKGIESKMSSWGYHLPREPSTAAVSSPVVTSAPSGTPTEALLLPAAWWVGIPSLPATMVSPGPGVGDSLATASHPMTVTTSGPILSMTPQVPLVDALPGGLSVTFTVDGGERWTGHLRAPVKPSAASDGGTAQSISLLATEVIPSRLVGKVGKLEVAYAGAHPELAVPLTALAEAEDGSINVLARLSGSGTVPISVTLGDQSDGWVAITSGDSRLREGTVVELH